MKSFTYLVLLVLSVILLIWISIGPSACTVWQGEPVRDGRLEGARRTILGESSTLELSNVKGSPDDSTQDSVSDDPGGGVKTFSATGVTQGGIWLDIAVKHSGLGTGDVVAWLDRNPSRQIRGSIIDGHAILEATASCSVEQWLAGRFFIDVKMSDGCTGHASIAAAQAIEAKQGSRIVCTIDLDKCQLLQVSVRGPLGLPVRGASVASTRYIDGEPGTKITRSSTDHDGIALLRCQQWERFIVVVDAEGYLPYRAERYYSGDSRTAIDVVLESGLYISGRVTVRPDAAREGLEVFWRKVGNRAGVKFEILPGIILGEGACARVGGAVLPSADGDYLIAGLVDAEYIVGLRVVRGEGRRVVVEEGVLPPRMRVSDLPAHGNDFQVGGCLVDILAKLEGRALASQKLEVIVKSVETKWEAPLTLGSTGAARCLLSPGSNFEVSAREGQHLDGFARFRSRDSGTSQTITIDCQARSVTTAGVVVPACCDVDEVQICFWDFGGRYGPRIVFKGLFEVGNEGEILVSSLPDGEFGVELIAIFRELPSLPSCLCRGSVSVRSGSGLATIDPVSITWTMIQVLGPSSEMIAGLQVDGPPASGGELYRWLPPFYSEARGGQWVEGPHASNPTGLIAVGFATDSPPEFLKLSVPGFKEARVERPSELTSPIHVELQRK